jgi:hypothetical protein
VRIAEASQEEEVEHAVVHYEPFPSQGGKDLARVKLRAVDKPDAARRSQGQKTYLISPGVEASRLQIQRHRIGSLDLLQQCAHLLGRHQKSALFPAHR